MIENQYEAKFARRLRAIPKRTLYAAAAAFIVGVLFHLAALTGLTVNGDNMVPVISNKWLMTQGKWAFGYFADMRGLVNMNIVTGLIGIVWLSLTAALTVATLDIRSNLLSALTGVAIVAFPSVMCTFLYNAPDIFFFALLLSTLAVFVSVRFRFGFVLGVPLLALSIGVYQTYVGYAAGLLLLVSIMDLLDGKKPLRAVVLRGLLYVGVLLAAVALYYGILLLCIGSPANLQSYRSMNEIGSFSLPELMAFTKAAYHKVLRFFLFDGYGVIGGRACMWLYRGALLLSALLAIMQIARAKLYRQPVRTLLAVALASLFPIAVHAIVILGKNADTHWIMIYPFVLVFAALMKLSDTASAPADSAPVASRNVRDACAFAAKLLPAALTVMLVANWYLITTENYARMRLAYEGAYGTCAVIAAGILNEDTFTEETPVAVIGYIADDSTDFAHLDNFTGSFDRDYLFNSWIAQRMIARYVQIPMTYVEVADKERILASDWFADQPAYPDKGYIASHDGMLVVKLSPDEPVIFG